MNQIQTYNGKTILSTRGKMPMYQRYDTVSMIPVAYKAYTGAMIGDTVNYLVTLDSGLRIGKRQLVPNGANVKVTSLILGILTNQESVIADLDVSKRKLASIYHSSRF